MSVDLIGHPSTAFKCRVGLSGQRDVFTCLLRVSVAFKCHVTATLEDHLQFGVQKGHKRVFFFKLKYGKISYASI